MPANSKITAKASDGETTSDVEIWRKRTSDQRSTVTASNKETWFNHEGEQHKMIQATQNTAQP